MRDRVDVAEAVVAGGLGQRAGFLAGGLGHCTDVAPFRLGTANTQFLAGDLAMGDVVDVVHGAGIAKKVARIVPVAVIKG